MRVVNAILEVVKTQLMVALRLLSDPVYYTFPFQVVLRSVALKLVRNHVYRLPAAVRSASPGRTLFFSSLALA